MFAAVGCGVIVSGKKAVASQTDQPFRELQVILSINRNVAFSLVLTGIVIVILLFDNQ
jgi:septum formation inhibitor-activating ATPase MinD